MCQTLLQILCVIDIDDCVQFSPNAKYVMAVLGLHVL